MSDQKHNSHAPVFVDEGSNGTHQNGNGSHSTTAESLLRDRREKGLVASDGKDVGGWEAYRRWLTRVQAPTQSRAPLDAGLYTWKGYRNWSDKVRREWSPDE